MTRRRRIIGLALIALAAPFPALALDGDGGDYSPTPPGTLTVTASLDSCGLAGSQIMCKIDAGWSSLEGAENYTVSITGADGSVVDNGQVTGQSTSVWVTYVGSGTYSVTVTAWGTPPGSDDDGSPEVIARSESVSGGEVIGVTKSAPEPSDSLKSRNADKAPLGSEEPPAVSPDTPKDPVGDRPGCDEPETDEPSVEPLDDPEAAPEDEGEIAAADAAEPEVVDTIPVDDDCSR